MKIRLIDLIETICLVNLILKNYFSLVINFKNLTFLGSDSSV